MRNGSLKCATLAITGILAYASLAPLAGQVAAEELTIGARVAPSNLDPQMSALGSDLGYYHHIYEPLFEIGELSDLSPALAESYKLIDNNTWEMKLHQGVTFHDGSAFDAEDVIFTLNRLRTQELPGNDGLVKEMLGPVVSIEAVDSHTLKIVTSEPTPDLLNRLSEFSILSSAIGVSATTEDFNTGKAAIGTGPFKLVKWDRGEKLVLERFDDYWQGPAEFSTVTFKGMSNDPARIAALLAGDVDIIDYVPPLDAARLRNEGGVEVFTAPSGRVIFLQVDAVDDTVAQLTDKAGQPLVGKNPLEDLRVRKALKLSISQDLIVTKIMDNLAFKATQGIPEGFGGYDPDIPLPSYDPEKAKALLAEAGYPKGFGLTLSCPNDRYVNDALICQGVGQMWSKIGIDTKIDTMPKSVYFKKLRENAFSAFMLGWGNDAGNSISLLSSVIETRDDDKGRGSWNASFSNPDLDKMIDNAIIQMDEETRNKALAEAMAMAIEEVALIPLHAQAVIVAAKNGLSYTPRANEQLLAYFVRQAK